jgi:Zn-dependent membrane protease YugP
MFFDPMYFVFVGPALLLGLWARWRVKSTVKKYAQVATRGGMTGADVAQSILDSEGITDVRIEPVRGFLSDHYDSRHKVLRLSPQIYNGRSVTAAGIAAHEVGHAIQHARNYAPLAFRQVVAPAAAIGSNLSFFLIFGGILLHATGLAWFGVAAFSVAVMFTLVTLPVEFDASARAKRVLTDMGLVTQTEGQGVSAVLNAAAMTYVAAAVAAVAQLAYWIILIGGRR